MSDSAALVQHLKTVLQDLHRNPHPHIPNPPSCKKRASVALVLRVRPNFPDTGAWAPLVNFEKRLDYFFDQDWVQNGDPEVLFIKRAARTGDRWTGHIALPGGKRECGDDDDKDASVRETAEEVGLDLRADHCMFVGNLAERLITTNWGNTPLMVLCPFVFLLLRHDLPPLSLQPTEVHSTHWVPIRGLLSPALRSTERADVSDRLKPQRGPFMKALIRAATGQLTFSSTILTPSESLYCSSAPNFIPTSSSSSVPKDIISYSAELLGLGFLFSQKPPSAAGRPYLLWGLTQGIVAELLHDIDPQATSTLTSWPTFSHWDIRAILWIITRKLRTGETTISTTPKGSNPSRENTPVPRITSIDNTTTAVSLPQRPKLPAAAAADFPDEYFRLMRKAVIYAFVVRVNAVLILAAIVIARYYV